MFRVEPEDATEELLALREPGDDLASQLGLADAGQAVQRGAQLDIGRPGEQSLDLGQLAITADERVRAEAGRLRRGEQGRSS